MSPTRRALRVACILHAVAACFFGRAAFAAEPSAPPIFSAESGGATSTGLGPTLLERPHTVAIIEAGLIALPTAPISPTQEGGSTPFGAFGKGDATIELSLHILYRATPQWAFGAGILFAPQPTSARGTVPGTNLDRTHSRSYYTLGAEVRYFPVRFRWVEAWVGLTAGAVVIADRYSTNNGIPRPTILGVPEVTVRTEGGTIGAQVGVDWMFADRWVVGAAARSERWLLPSVPAETPLGDRATLTGIVEVLQFALNVGYRLPL